MPVSRPPFVAERPYPTGLFIPMCRGNGAGAAVAAADVLYLRRFFVPTPITPASVGVRTTVGGAGSSFKVGVWREAAASRIPTGLPIMSNNTGEGTTVNSTNDPAPVTGVSMLPGTPYWAGFVFTGTLPTVLVCLSSDLEFVTGIGAGIGNSAGATAQGYSTPFVYAGDIAALDLTAAVLTLVLGALVPLPFLGT